MAFERELDIVIGPVVTRVALPDALVEELEGTALAAFCRPAGPARPHGTIAVLAPRAADPETIGEPSAPGLTCQRQGRMWRVARHGMVARLDPERPHHLAVEQWADASSLDTALRFLLAQSLPSRQGLLLHASTLAWREKAYAFAGVSGAGKSTLARHHEPAAAIFCDEVSLVSRDGGRWQVHATPFWGELDARAPIPSAPLAAGHLLVRDPVAFIAPVAMREALGALLRCVLFFAEPASGSEAVLHTASLLVREVAWHYLSCPPGMRFWEVPSVESSRKWNSPYA